MTTDEITAEEAALVRKVLAATGYTAPMHERHEARRIVDRVLPPMPSSGYPEIGMDAETRLAQVLGWGDFRECSAAQTEQFAAWAQEIRLSHLGNPHVREELFAERPLTV